MYVRSVPQAEGEPLQELSYEVSFAAMPSFHSLGERGFLTRALDSAGYDAYSRRIELHKYASAETRDDSDTEAIRQEAEKWRSMDKGYGTLSERLQWSSNCEVLFTFSELILSVEALRLRAKVSGFYVKRSLWMPSNKNENPDYLVMDKALSMAGQLLSFCDSRQLDDPAAYFDPSLLTQPKKQTTIED